MKISVIGTGYLGATHAACLAALGHDVLGVDTDAAKVAALGAGAATFFEPGLDELLRKGVESGRLRFTTSYEHAADAEVHFVCVGTPQLPGALAADVSYVDSAVISLAEHLRRPTLVVGKSTVPVGTAARLREDLHALAPAGRSVQLAWNPEFLREGRAVEDSLRPDRIVLGVESDHAERLLRQTYAPIIGTGTPVVVTDLQTAELVKTAANAMLATRISFINAMAEICEAAGADVTQLATAISYDDRIGGKCLSPGLGFGGGCLPKDIRAFMARAEELGAVDALLFLREVDAINMRRRARTVDLARELLDGTVADRHVAVLGAAFKPDSDDVRDSPALDVAQTLSAQGAHVVVHDPVAVPNARRARPDLCYAESTMAACRGADVVLLLTEWTEFRTVDPDVLGTVVAGRRVVDGRNVLDAERWRAAGWTYRALGRR